MKRASKLWLILLLALWVPATMHCTLETVPNFSFLQRCCGDEAAQTDDACETDFCSALESGFYKIEDHPKLAAGPALLLTVAVWDWAMEPPAATRCFGPVCESPPELPRPWQFHHRAALPPRAPSPLA